MTDNITVKILWLSDIHFRQEYDKDVFPAWKKEELKKAGAIGEDVLKKVKSRIANREGRLPLVKPYLDSFFSSVDDYLKNQQDGEKSIDYVFISGDLASSGSQEDYESFNKMVIQPLRKKLGPKTRFLTIPGNHDVTRKNAKFFKQFQSQLQVAIRRNEVDRQRNARTLFMQENPDYFELIFANYTDFFKTYIADGQPGMSADYAEHGMYGFVVDKEKNLFISLVNSAWFALGNEFDKFLVGEFMEDGDALTLETKLKKEKDENKRKKLLEDFAMRFLKAKNYLVEYGEQILGDHLMNTITEAVEDNQGFCFVSSFHHPNNWLQYSTKYHFDNVRTGQLFVNRLLAKTHILLTGHEHVPSYVPPEKLSDMTWHIKGGMFMQDDLLLEKHEQHRFSILEINTSEFWFCEQKYIYDWLKPEWKLDAENSGKTYELKQTVHVLKPERRKTIVDKLCKPEILQKIMGTYFIAPSDMPDRITSVKISDLRVKLFRFYKKGVIYKLVVIPLDNQFIGDSLANPSANKSTPHPFDSILEKAGIGNCEKLSLTILTPDFLVDEKAIAWLSEPHNFNVKKEEEALAARADLIFNLARHDYFYYYEEAHRSSRKLLTNKLKFEEVCQLELALQVVPFWFIDRYG